MSRWADAAADALVDEVRELRAKLDDATALIRRLPAATKHGPMGRGGSGPCDTDCAKCAAEAWIAAEEQPK